MKRFFLYLMISIIMINFAGCEQEEQLIDTKNVDDLAIYYGVRSYAYFSSDQENIKSLADMFNHLSFRESDQEMDGLSMFTVSFGSKDDDGMMICVDKNGVFWLGGSADNLEIASGSFDYQMIEDIYKSDGD